MKKYFVLFVFILVRLFAVNGQEINLAFNSTDAGRNISLTKNFIFEKSELGVGLRYNINKWAHPDDLFLLFQKRLYALKPLHHFGVQAYYHRFLNNSFFLFYDVQYSYANTFNRTYVYSPVVENPFLDGNGDMILYKKLLNYYGPFSWLEQYVGIGLKLILTDDIFLKQKAGIGANLVFGEDPGLPVNRLMVGSEFGMYYSIGLSYRF